MKTTRKHLLSIFVAIAMTATASKAAITNSNNVMYTDFVSFSNAVSLYNPGTISFSSIPTGAFSPSNGAGSFTNNGYIMNANSSGGLYGETYVVDPTIRFLSVGGAAEDDLVMTFSTNVYAVGGWFMAAENDLKASSFTATIVSAAGVTNIFTNNTTTNNSPSVNYDNTFRGWIYNTNIVSLTLSTDPNNGGFPTAANQITLAVPEPSTYALLALSAAGLAGYVIRRRRS